MNDILRPERSAPDDAPGTLGALLYADRSQTPIPEADWARLVHAIADGDLCALHALYVRAHRLVFTLAVRLTGDEEVAEAVTVETFRDIRRTAATYDADAATVLAWIMNLARAKVVGRMQAGAPVRSAFCGSGVRGPDGGRAAARRDRPLRKALNLLSVAERQALETVYFSEMTYSQAAQRLSESPDAISTRIRSALAKLRQALDGGGLP